MPRQPFLNPTSLFFGAQAELSITSSSDIRADHDRSNGQTESGSSPWPFVDPREGSRRTSSWLPQRQSAGSDSRSSCCPPLVLLGRESRDCGPALEVVRIATTTTSAKRRLDRRTCPTPGSAPRQPQANAVMEQHLYTGRSAIGEHVSVARDVARW